jgi:hypothetical protein
MSEWFRRPSNELRRAKEELYSTGYTGWMLGCGRFLVIVLAFAIIGVALHAIVAFIAIGTTLALIVTTWRWFRGRI